MTTVNIPKEVRMDNLACDLQQLIDSEFIMCAWRGEDIYGNIQNVLLPNHVINISIGQLRASMVVRIHPSTKSRKLLLFRPLAATRQHVEHGSGTIRIIGASIRPVKGGYAVSAPVIPGATIDTVAGREPNRVSQVVCSSLSQAMSLGMRAISTGELPVDPNTASSETNYSTMGKGGRS